MRRELKFRAWHKEYKQMYPVTVLTNEVAGLDGFERRDSHSSCDCGDCEECDLGSVRYNESLTELVVMQYTGLKDRHGVEIYEGDVVREKRFDQIAAVTFETVDVASCGCCFPSFTGSGFKIPLDEGIEDIEVIGNIYENPDLLHQEDYGKQETKV